MHDLPSTLIFTKQILCLKSDILKTTMYTFLFGHVFARWLCWRNFSISSQTDCLGFTVCLDESIDFVYPPPLALHLNRESEDTKKDAKTQKSMTIWYEGKRQKRTKTTVY